MKKQLLSLLLVVSLLAQFVTMAMATSEDGIEVTEFELHEVLETVVTTTLYDGDVQDTTHSNQPTEGSQYLLVNVTASVETGTMLDLDDIAIQLDEVVYHRLSVDSFLSTHNYTTLRHGTTIMASSGWVVFEIPVTFTEEQVSAQLTLSLVEEVVEEVVEEEEEEADVTEEEEATQTTSDDILDIQAAISLQLQSFCQSGTYTLENPLALLDPYDASPLSALIAFDTEEAGTVSVEIAGKDDYTTVTHAFDEVATTHILPIYGLYAATNNKVTITFTSESGQVTEQEVSIQTGDLPENIAIAEVTIADTSEMADGFTYCIVEGGTSCAIDANGDIRWYTGLSFAGIPIKRLANGNILSGCDSVLYEFDMLGRIHNEYLISGAHHEVVELSNGDFLVAASIGDTVEDYVVRLDRETGMIVQDWNFQDILDMDYVSDADWQYHVYNNQAFNNPDKSEEELWAATLTRASSDWFHNNALYYNEEENTIMASGRMKDAIVKFDAETGEVIWILADPNVEWAETTYADKMLTPIGDDFEYAYGQHAITMADDGDILLFDNGNYRSKTAEDALDPSDCYSRGVRYSIDEENMTVEQVWQYGKELGNAAYSSYISDIDYLDTDHYLINFGGILIDVATGESYNSTALMRDPDAVDAQGITRIVEIKDDVVIYELHLSSASGFLNTYRAERMTPYYEGEGYVDLTMVGQRLGSLEQADTADDVVTEDTAEDIVTEDTTEDVVAIVYDDVNEADWFYSGVMSATEAGLFIGTSDTTFSPENQMTVEMVSIVLSRISDGATEADANPLADYGFELTDAVSREGLSTMLYSYALTTGAEPASTELDFADAEDISDWAVDAMTWCVEQGILNGTSDTTLDPLATTTRAQVATVMMRLAGLE